MSGRPTQPVARGSRRAQPPRIAFGAGGLRFAYAGPLVLTDPDKLNPAPIGAVAARSARGGTLLLSAQAAQLLANVVTGMLLARLLTPADFGIVAMVVSLTAFVGSFSDFGFGMAALQREQLDHSQLSDLFWLNAKLSSLIFLFTVLMAPVLVWFYEEPRVTWVTVVMAAVLVVRSLGVQHRAAMNRRMDYNRLTVLQLVTTISGAVVGVGAALLGARYWALVLQQLSMSVVHTAGLWSLGRWRPSRPERRSQGRAGLRELLIYGREYTLYRVVSQIGVNLDRVLVGYFRGSVAMGLYDNSFRWSRYPLMNVFTPLLDVAVSGLSRLQSDVRAFRDSFRKGALPVYTLVLPSLVFFVVEPRVVILTLLGPQWVDAIPLFQVLCLGGFASSLLAGTRWIYLSEARTARQLRWAIVEAVVTIAGVSIGIRWGALGVAVGFAVATWLILFPAILYCVQGSRIALPDFLAPVWRPAAAAGSAGLALWLIPPILADSSVLAGLLARAAVFSVFYVLVWLALPGGRAAVLDLRRVAELLVSGPSEPSLDGGTRAS